MDGGGSTTKITAKMATNFESGGSLTELILRGAVGHALLPTAIVAVLGVVVLAMSRLESLDTNEPPLLKPRIPFCGHLVGMLKWQVGYMQMLR